MWQFDMLRDRIGMQKNGKGTSFLESLEMAHFPLKSRSPKKICLEQFPFHGRILSTNWSDFSHQLARFPMKLRNGQKTLKLHDSKDSKVYRNPRFTNPESINHRANRH